MNTIPSGLGQKAEDINKRIESPSRYNVKIGIISDTHDHIGNVLHAVRIFQDMQAKIVIHAGDYITGRTVRAFAGVKLVGVLGNNDLANRQEIIKAFSDIGGQVEQDVCELVLEGLKFAVYHGTDKSLKEKLVESNRYDVIICGHTHLAENKRVGMYKHAVFLNPGTAHGLFFGTLATAMILDTQTRNADLIYL